MITNRIDLRPPAAAMAFVAATLAVISPWHLAEGGNGASAGIPEAIIGIVLAGGAVVVWHYGIRARIAGLVATGLAIVGFVVGLSFTARGGPVIDLGYHLAVLPVLIATFVTLLRGRPEPGSLSPILAFIDRRKSRASGPR